MNNSHILIIDDEVQIRKLLEITLQSNGFIVKETSSGKEGLLAAANHPPDLIILDLGLPDESGHEILKKLRKWYTNAIIILSVLSSEEDIVSALDNVANDYLVKPFRTGELLARIRSCLRQKTTDENISLLNFEDLQIDLIARLVKKNNEIIKLTATEYDLISLFAKNEVKVLTHHYLLKQI